MMLPRLLLLLTILGCTAHLGAQDKVKGNITTNDTVRLEVIRLLPDSFPRVSVMFRASGTNGEPIQNLDTSNVHVNENGLPCKVVAVNRVSKNWAVNSALVVDHSGSMRMDELLRRHWDSLPPSAWKPGTKTMREHTNGEVDSDSLIQVRIAPADPAWYHTPLWYAKHAAVSYVQKTDATKDQNCLIGFSTDVDVTYPLSTSQEGITRSINGLTTSGETAFYDAVSRAIDEADKGDGIRVVIAMTDGKDNNSRESLSAVILKAKSKKIPVYVIGLGDVDQSPLRRLARETGGLAYFTNEASNLGDIYRRITLQIQSIYEVVYESASLSSADSLHDVQLIFDVDGKYLSSRTLSFVLPPEVVGRLIEKEAAIQQQSIVADPEQPETSTEFPWGVTGLAIGVVAAGVLTARYIRRNPKKEGTLEIVNVYPNPTSGPFTIVINKTGTLPVELVLRSSSGVEIYRANLTGTETSLDAGHLDSGTYYATVFSNGETSSARTVVIVK